MGGATETNTAFEVELRRTGVVLTVPADRALLDVICDVAPDTPYGCREGYCGACLTTVLEGRADHRDDYLTPEERDADTEMLICVGRSRTPRLVLDL